MKCVRCMLSIFAAALLFASCASAPKTAAEGKAPEAKPAQTPEWKTFRGKVTAIEKYGHAVTDIAFADMQKAGYEHGDIVTVRFDNGYTFNAPVVANYDVDKGAFLVRTNYAGGFIAACINYGKLNVTANVGVGSALTVSMKQKAGYREQYALRSLTGTDKRNGYASDEAFANFRCVSLGSIGKNILYRGSHPAKKGWTRAPYASSLMEKAKIKTVVDMSDSRNELTSYLDPSNPQYSAYYASIDKAGGVVCLSMNMDFTSDIFAAGIIGGLRFMISHEGPYYLHCNEGKDRTGFIMILLESLMGASKEEAMRDYMQSYVNFYHVERGSYKYNVIAKANFEPMYKAIVGGLSPVKGARAYLSANGMTDAEIEALVQRLR
ncbi:tyrosine-protein phosphatase [Treponema socranskii]|uniref:tyrosine-protein phosphatase n=1 Tax=Treponema socranskii TaxID=53419 RepID=UPI00361BDAF7